MKKTKLFTSIAALALVLGLGACEGDVIINVGDVTPDESETTTESSETTGDTTPSESTPEGGTSEEGIVFGFELDGVLNAIDGGYILKDDGSPYLYELTYTSNLDDALKFTYEAGEAVGEYYISTEIDGVATWVAIVTTSDNHTNVNYVTDKTPLYWNPTYECWGNETQTYFLCQNATFGCFYASAISQYINSSPIAALYNIDGSKVTGFVGEVYQEPITDIPYFEVEEPEDGGQYYLGFPYTSGSTTDWYMFNGTTDSYGDYLQCSVLGYNDPTSAVLVKTTKNEDNTWGLTFTLNETEYTIYAWPSAKTDGTIQYGEITFIATANLESANHDNAVTDFSWDNDRATFTVTLSNGDWYFSTYQGKSSVSLTSTSNNYAASHLYTANPKYVVPEEPQHEESGIEYSSPTSFTADAIIAEYPEYTLGSGSGSQAASVQLEGKTTTLGEVSIAWGEGGTTGVRLWSASPNQIRVYKGTTDTIISVSEGYKLDSIVITASQANSYNDLANFTFTGGTASVSGATCTVTPTDTTVSFSLASSGTNTYLNEILVYYTAA